MGGWGVVIKLSDGAGKGVLVAVEERDDADGDEHDPHGQERETGSGPGAEEGLHEGASHCM
ncbi:hypothetical protein GCM10012320_20710 [Sinomonas cellulolyticus]|nr:hypothetical protein GCM10012320_20710 [Sinomonas sp. KCTC 49339]